MNHALSNIVHYATIIANKSPNITSRIKCMPSDISCAKNKETKQSACQTHDISQTTASSSGPLQMVQPVAPRILHLHVAWITRCPLGVLCRQSAPIVASCLCSDGSSGNWKKTASRCFEVRGWNSTTAIATECEQNRNSHRPKKSWRTRQERRKYCRPLTHQMLLAFMHSSADYWRQWFRRTRFFLRRAALHTTEIAVPKCNCLFHFFCNPRNIQLEKSWGIPFRLK